MSGTALIGAEAILKRDLLHFLDKRIAAIKRESDELAFIRARIIAELPEHDSAASPPNLRVVDDIRSDQ